MSQYLSTEQEWSKLLANLLQSPRAGLDTEFYGVDFDSKLETTQHRAQVHVWSCAVPDPSRGLDARGLPYCSSYVLPSSALTFFRPWLESESHVKYTHHAPAEDHPIYSTTAYGLEGVNAGVHCRGLVDTLSWARWALPERHPHPGFGLKPLVRECLAIEPVGDFEDLFSEPTYRYVDKKRCVCGADREGGPACRKRKLPEHTKELYQVPVEGKRRLLDLSLIVPGHALFPLLVEYSGADSEYSLKLGYWLRNKVVARPLTKL